LFTQQVLTGTIQQAKGKVPAGVFVGEPRPAGNPPAAPPCGVPESSARQSRAERLGAILPARQCDGEKSPGHKRDKSPHSQIGTPLVSIHPGFELIANIRFVLPLFAGGEKSLYTTPVDP